MKHKFLKSILFVSFFLAAFGSDLISGPVQIPDSILKKADSLIDQLPLQIDTLIRTEPEVITADTVTAFDTSLIQPASETAITNTQIFIYIILTIGGLILFFYIFVVTLFKTLHKKRSSRQSILLSWNSFFLISVIWIFIIWGLAAGFWTIATFMIVMIFLFIISLIMTIIALKSN
jgi:membrane-associated HD superfamily phosphohydrolase